MAAPETRIIGAVLLEQRKVMVALAGGEAAFAEVLAALPAERREGYDAVSMLS
ncbi:MAG: hypothetical protein FJ104_02885 [Deltaproteobacteria bacterium]|nr:hypothetical protein [Deltaproteobacteria bacterium]